MRQLGLLLGLPVQCMRLISASMISTYSHIMISSVEPVSLNSLVSRQNHNFRRIRALNLRHREHSYLILWHPARFPARNPELQYHDPAETRISASRSRLLINSPLAIFQPRGRLRSLYPNFQPYRQLPVDTCKTSHTLYVYVGSGLAEALQGYLQSQQNTWEAIGTRCVRALLHREKNRYVCVLPPQPWKVYGAR